MKELVPKLLIVLPLCLGYHLCFFGFYIEKQISVATYSSLVAIIYLATIVYSIRLIWFHIKGNHKFTS